MPNQFIIDAGDYASIERHLFQTRDEQVAFCFAQTEAAADGVIFRAVECYLVPPEELDIQTSRHVALTEEAQAKLIKMAWERRASLVELHSHTDPRYEAVFSPTDLAGFESFVPHVWWRLRGRPYLAVVVAPTGFDALVWRTSPEAAEPLHVFQVGDEEKRPTDLTLRAAEEASHVC